MKRRQKSGSSSRRGELLELWMGEPVSSPPSAPKPINPLLIVGLVLGAIVAIGLARYAIDVLFMVLGLVALALVFHVLGNWLAESDILSPGWFTIISLAVLLGGWAFLVPAEGLAGLRRYVPKPVAEAFERMESRGWARRAFLGPGEGGPAPAGGIGAAPSAAPHAAPADSPAGISSGTVVLTTSRATTAVGEPVVLTARVSARAASRGTTGSVRFFDGLQPLGSAELRHEGRAFLASLTVTDLGVGDHDLRAEAVGVVGLSGGISESVRHTVIPRRE